MTLQSNPNLVGYVRSFNLTLSGTSSGRRLPSQSSAALTFVFPLLSSLVALSLRVADGLRFNWPDFTSPLQSAITRGFEKNQDLLTSVRLTEFGIPATLWLMLPKLTSFHLKRNPLPLVPGKHMFVAIKARVSEFECIDDPRLIFWVARDAPQVLAKTTRMAVRIPHLNDPIATFECFWMLPVPPSSI